MKKVTYIGRNHIINYLVHNSQYRFTVSRRISESICMYPVNLVNFGIKLREGVKFFACFHIKKLFFGRDFHYVALIYVYMSYYIKK